MLRGITVDHSNYFLTSLPSMFSNAKKSIITVITFLNQTGQQNSFQNMNEFITKLIKLKPRQSTIA